MSRERTEPTDRVGVVISSAASRQRRRRGRAHVRTLAPLLAALLVLVACDDDASTSEPTEDRDAAVDDEVEPEDAAVEDDAEPDDADGDGGTAPSASEQEQPPRLPVPDAAAIELHTPVSGEGAWPQLDWAAVTNAERYRLTVYGPDGRAFWRWTGTDDQVVFGGFTRSPEDGSAVTPQVLDGMSWSVIAFDADGRIVAQSDERPLGP